MKKICGAGFEAIVVILLFTSCGCSGGNFLSSTYQSSVAYFNTYYNAKKTFDEAVEETQKNQPTTLQINIFLSPNVPQTVRPKFNSVIEKCSKIIQFYPQSNLIDDALLLIGKSYYFINEILPAQKKFLELLENFPRSDLRLETRLVLAKTYYIAEKTNDALNLLTDLITESLEEENRDIAIEGLLLEGQIFIDRNDHTRAIESYKRALDISGDKKLLALAAYQLAWCHESKADLEAASPTYMKVLDFDPNVSLEYNARLRAAVMFSLIGNFQRSLDLLQDLHSEPLTPEQRSQVELELGNTYQRIGDYTKALIHYSLVDSLYKRTDASAKSNYQCGILYEKKLFDLQRAKLYYDKAKNEFPQSEITPTAAKKSEILVRYVSYRTEFEKYDSLLQVFLHPELFRDSSASSHVVIDSTSRTQQTEIFHPDSIKSMSVLKGKDSSKTVSIPIDTIHYNRSSNQFSLGVLFFVDLDNADSSACWLTMMLREYPNSKFAPQALYVLAEVYRSKHEPSTVDSLYGIILTKYPNSEYALNIKRLSGQVVTSTRTDSAEILYAAAIQLLDIGNRQQAVQELKKILRKYPKHPIDAKVRFALGWIYENILINKDSAITYYRLLQEKQPGSIYVERIRSKLAFIDNKETEQKPDIPLPPPGSESKDTTKQNIQEKHQEHQKPGGKQKEPEKDSKPELKKGDDNPDQK